jgi:hypothetical protein
MARPEQIENEELRRLVEEAHGQMRRGKGTEAVRKLGRAFLLLLELKPELLEETIELRPGRTMLAVMRWPTLGANLKPESVRAGRPEIEFVRKRFAVSEAMTYYEYTLETAVAKGA